jgi:hypothetical protein
LQTVTIAFREIGRARLFVEPLAIEAGRPIRRAGMARGKHHRRENR